MKKQLTPQEKAYRDQRDMKYIGMFSACGFLGLGIWMLIDPASPKHARVEKVTVSLVKDLWGLPCGIILTAIGLFILIRAILGLRKIKKNHQATL